jgi:uncharacterized membrane protein YcaP (DUF421 family)
MNNPAAPSRDGRVSEACLLAANRAMKKDQIHLSDWKRILFGESPPQFVVEVLVRAGIMYLVLLACARLLGKRMNGQLTLTEMAVMITLGGIISLPMQMPDRGLAQGLLLLILAFCFQQGVNRLGVKSPGFEKVAQGELSILVRDGVLQPRDMLDARVSREQLFAALRAKTIFNLGRVDRLYLEACGIYSIFPAQNNRPGLSLLPRSDEGLRQVQPRPGYSSCACQNCGFVARAGGDRKCENCGSDEWTEAVS